MIFHDNIVKNQQKIDRLDGKQDHLLHVGNEEATQKATTTLFDKVDEIRNNIEADSLLDFNNKMKYLRGLNDVLITFEIYARKENGVSPDQITELIPAYVTAMELEKAGSSIKPLIEANEAEIGEVLLSSSIFSRNPGFAESKALVQRRRQVIKPEQILPTLQRNPNNPDADSLIKTVAYLNPEDLYSYAQVGDTLAILIQSHTDPLVQMIGKLAQMNTGRLYFPFLDNLYRGKMTMEEIEANMEDKYKYFRLLVNTEIGYAGRFRNGDTPVVMSALSGMIKDKAVEGFINVINGLHDAPDNIRMKEVEPLNSQELYYLCVMGDPEIYTSSYLKVYDRMFQRLSSPSSDTLLASVNFDFFKKFIKMAAGYNTLDHFLSKMQKGNAQNLMKTFAANLEKTTNLENAVDVADSYASISSEPLRKLILEVTQKSYAELQKSNNKRGIVIYDILNSIFESMNPASKIDISAKFGIPTFYSVKNSSLKNAAGRIIIQQFFYGDKDGYTEFSNFRAAYSNSNWKITDKSEWIEVSSVKGAPITIYSNKPLNAASDLDAQAQADLSNYLEERDLSPTVVIHRGHSFYVRFTIKQLAPTAKIVLLGSCGGYHNIGGVLNVAPTAHIIASKQVGSGTINQPMIVNLTDDMRLGKDLNWPQKWKQFAKLFGNNDRFDDYIPPHKNLGAIFIMAYKRMFGNEGS
ncbi:MAG: hypothetical protein JWQ09_1037 [Segetibacter sp.]|nr:hypothetical protein [Segetibacter sp.]